MHPLIKMWFLLTIQKVIQTLSATMRSHVLHIRYKGNYIRYNFRYISVR